MKLKLSLLTAALLSSSLFLLPETSHARLPVAVDGQQLPTLAPMLEKVTPGVVSIQVSGAKEVRRRVDPFDFFFGNPAPRSQKRPFSGLGSGVIIDADEGYVVTNNHVIDEADNIIVTLKDGREFKAELVGTDKESDIALLQIEGEDLTAVKLADSDKLRVGDFSVAIGNPFGLSHTVTSGIVSALGRSGLNIEGYEDFIQTDAAINQGNSGGALVNLRGELIGINTAILGASGGNVGIGFAIPSNMMKNLVDQIIEYGQVRRGSLGIRGRTLDAGLAKAQGFDVKQGAFVQEVVKDSAADEAGIKANDVIVALNGDKIESFEELRGKIATLGEGKKVRIEVYRDGDTRTLNVELKGASEQRAEADRIHPSLQGAVLESGERNGNQGIVVVSVEERSPAARVGLQEGDVIMQVNRQRVASVRDMKRLIDDIQGNIVLGIKRGRDSVFYLIQ
ncbi:serine endoprotease DegQ [Pseudoalteromonas rubra]|uniref:Serine endoprotease DegQ n=1 Tax=Pseudoalteromonas rubra TaxID=43658 RepID=A0A5S3WPD7_9GAMM|nr:DegQ family serine endoprotease [Pseudoalteromonas rubra]TMP30077.1 serine endoprotease DegQ [Pseudoalteromonas rubra]TMP33040.1 serine endoprotease DegQ [Pseudoalteromonas rubra]TMP35653.1 serine endoprotease DegQ [Pseudoalteromonas rubra]